MRPFPLLALGVLLAGPAGAATADTAKPAASSGDQIVSVPLKGFDLGSIKTFDFTEDVGDCFAELTMALGPIGILAVGEGDQPDVLADCRTAEVAGPQKGGTTQSVTTVTLYDPRTHRIVWRGFDASLEKAPARKVESVIDRLRSVRSAPTSKTSDR